MEIYLATRRGLFLARQENGNWVARPLGQEGQLITSIAVQGGFVLSGSRRGVYRSIDGGLHWKLSNRGLTLPHIRWLAFHPQKKGFALAGTEPAGIFYSEDTGETWHACPEVEDMRLDYEWSLPYSPEAGCVRGFALAGRRAYAAVEDGAVLVSDLYGKNWELASGSSGDANHWPAQDQVHSDVHSIEVFPGNPMLVFAPTGGGLYRSRDGGLTWTLLYRCYCRAVLLDPQDPEHFLFGPADGVDRGGKLIETRDGGKTWSDASTGMDTPWPTTMVERFTQLNDRLFAVLSDGRLYTTETGRIEWQQIVPGIPGINAVTGMHT
jgi:photosystem II stability/assembly factor-like uncharacterized protein